MNYRTPILAVGDTRLYELDRGLLEAHRGGQYIGCCWPRVLTEPDGAWFARRRGQVAVRHECREDAINYLTEEQR